MSEASFFCKRCGTYKRPVPGKKLRVCPRCRPEKVPETKSRPCNKTNVPCRDRQICKPEECVMALECDEGRKKRRKGL